MTAVLDSMQTPPETVRVGVAHGSIKSQLPEGSRVHNEIAADRAETPRPSESAPEPSPAPSAQASDPEPLYRVELANFAGAQARAVLPNKYPLQDEARLGVILRNDELQSTHSERSTFANTCPRSLPRGGAGPIGGSLRRYSMPR